MVYKNVLRDILRDIFLADFVRIILLGVFQGVWRGVASLYFQGRMLLWLIAILDWRVLILRHFSGQILLRF